MDSSETDLSSKSDVDLFRAMADAKNDRALAKAAWAEVYRRYRSQVLHYCYALVKGWGAQSRQIPDAWVQAVMIHAFKHAHTFDQPPDVSGREMYNRTSGWFRKITLRLVYDEVKKLAEQKEAAMEKFYHDNHVRLATDQSHRCLEALPRQVAEAEPIPAESKTMKALLTLPKRDAHILLWNMDYYDHQAKKFNTPLDVIKAITDEYKISVTNHRKIRNRAIKAIELAKKGPLNERAKNG